MMHRSIGTLAVAVLLAGWSLAAAQAPPAPEKHQANEKLAKTIIDCMIECQKCAAHCGHMVASGQKEHFRTMQLCTECAAVCALTQQLVYAHSPVLNHQAEACARICDVCAEACEKSAATDSMMKRCAEACRECAAACRALGKASPRQTAN